MISLVFEEYRIKWLKLFSSWSVQNHSSLYYNFTNLFQEFFNVWLQYLGSSDNSSIYWQLFSARKTLLLKYTGLYKQEESEKLKLSN